MERAVCDALQLAGEAGQELFKKIKGFEAMRALRKGQAAIFNLTRDIRGEVRIVERAFGIGASALAEAVAVIGERLNLQPA